MVTRSWSGGDWHLQTVRPAVTEVGRGSSQGHTGNRLLPTVEGETPEMSLRGDQVGCRVLVLVSFIAQGEEVSSSVVAGFMYHVSEKILHHLPRCNSLGASTVAQFVLSSLLADGGCLLCQQDVVPALENGDTEV